MLPSKYIEEGTVHHTLGFECTPLIAGRNSSRLLFLKPCSVAFRHVVHGGPQAVSEKRALQKMY
jgi:hypothetical protein